MEIKRSDIRLIFLFIVLVTFVVIYVMNNEKKKEATVHRIEYGVNLMLKDDLKFKEEKEEEKVEYVTYNGDLTGYAADCPACNGTLACKPKYDVYKNGVVTYNDVTYGNVRIVATSKNIACGSILKLKDTKLSNEDMYVIVLDRGVLGYDLDLLVESERYASIHIGRSKINYELIRNGW